MRILILEDQEVRQKKFLFNLVGHDVRITADVKECIKLLDSDVWHVLFLDHDIEGPWLCPSGPGTGYEVACWLEQHPEKQPKLIFTHTYNEVGAQNICRAVPKAMYFKYAWEATCLADALESMLYAQQRGADALFPSRNRSN
jgi:CheY-like chemotaxis protein